MYILVKIEFYAAFARTHLPYFQEQVFHSYVLIKIHLYGEISKKLYCIGVKATQKTDYIKNTFFTKH